jgi:ubiquinone/menaquinone biosynthesis C-methylase UbiE
MTDSVTMTNWKTSKPLVAAWDRGVKSWPVAMVYGAIVFGTDNRIMYKDMDSLGELPAGTRVLDVPSGGGVVLRALRPGHGLRYVAGDISPLMLERVRAEADRRHLEGIGTRQVDAGALPFGDGEFDVVATYSGLHCVPDPAKAVAEMFRVLVPGGELRGSVVVTGAGAREDAFIRLWQKRNILDVVVPADGVTGWITDAGFRNVRTRTSGSILYFRAVRPGVR